MHRNGVFLGASYMFRPYIQDPSTLEALAIREAMALALYERDTRIASDCKVVVDDIVKKTSPPFGAILHEILDRVAMFNSCNIGFESKSSNF